MIKKVSNQKSKNKKSATIVDDSLLKGEILRWIFTIVLSVITFSVAAYLISEVFHPDINKLLTEANQLSFLGINRPEPMESLIVRSGIVLIPILLFLFYMLFSKSNFIKKISGNSSFTVISTVINLSIVILIYKDFSALNPFNPGTGEQLQHMRDLEGKTNFEFYFKGLFLGNYVIVYCFILLPIIYGIFIWGIKKNNWELNRIYKNTVPLFSYLFIGAIILSIVLMNIFNFPYTFENKYDFNAVYYSMTQVFAGVPLLVDNFTNTYGLYPHFLNPLFQLIGLSVFNFSLIMSILLGISLIFIVIFLKRHITNSIILLLSFLALINFSYLNLRFIAKFDCSFAFFPIRFIIPCTLLILTSLYLTNKSRRIYWFTFFLLGTFILWNPEIGMVCFVTWLLVNSYIDFYSPENKINYFKICKHWLYSVGILLIVFSFYYFIIYASYGVFPDFKLLFSYILIFGKYGFGALPMHLIHPWNIIAIIYATGILFALVKLYKRQVTIKSTLILLTTLIGFGFFIYFQGRSHNFTFTTSTCFGFILIALLTDELWQIIKIKNILILNFLFLIFLLFTSYSIFDILSNTNKITELIFQNKDKISQQADERNIKNNEAFIVDNTKTSEKIHVFTSLENESLYFNGNKRRSAFNPGWLELSFNSDLNRLNKMLLNSSYKVFIEPEKFKITFLNRALATVAASYKLDKNTEKMILMIPQTNKIPNQQFFSSDVVSLLYKKYTSDSTGTKMRVDDAVGTVSVSPVSEFSVHLLFHPEKQAYQFASLIGNMTDSAGFAVANNPATGKYYVCINGSCYELPIIEDKWIYLVLNFYSNKLEVYLNGNLSTSLKLEMPYRNSPQKVYIGNMRKMNLYFGEIAEVNISNKITPADDIKNIWTKISAVVN